MEGRVLMKAFLSGMPECRLGFNMHGEDCTFSSIVRQVDWESQRAISFIPPDSINKSEFEIMKYRMSDQVSCPFSIIPNVVESGRTRCSVRHMSSLSGPFRCAPVQSCCAQPRSAHPGQHTPSGC